ncbi:MAG: DNA recombination protein RmuC [Methyloversatilis discipulorum]|uniref:DNA recombination protein RmuC n=1 Tax=Methyloversatilis discipulorum TaxID=1119528 RepID=UPI0026EE6E90|nr:DNA recombination protein RmuC [Methyloversatilis discipulorum]MBT9515977.1 DNA recombination protein RmuC [Methyloversatilis discipulorum]
MSEFPLLLVLICLLQVLLFGAVAWLVLRVRALGGGLDVATQEGQRQTLAALHEGLQRQTERTVGMQADANERLRRAISLELGVARDAVGALQRAQQVGLAELSAALNSRQETLRTELVTQTAATLAEQTRVQQEALQNGLQNASVQLTASIESLTRTVNERLELLSGRVHERLEEGFRKTNETFTSVMARLATIDEAQKKIEGLSTSVVSLKELLGDKKARGAFGEVQLEALVRNALPPDAFEFQATLSNGARVDCLLRLPEPTGRVAVDSKFPLENYHRMFAADAAEADRRQAQAAFRADVRKHVDDIAAKYIIADETSDGAVMFLPAEAVFAELHAHHAEVIAYAQAKRVWIVSPTTLMAVLNTARAVLKDVETRKQIHLIRDALGRLAKDFTLFDKRMEKLATHIRQAHDDVQEVAISSRKISGQFVRIERAEADALRSLDAPEDGA